MKRLLLSLSVLMLAPAGPSDAQSGDAAYCAQLTLLYRRYVENSPGRQYDADAAIALDDCKNGNTAAGIPVLEKKLLESGFTLPERPRQ
ncbi:MAG TPA: hypothetical protein VNU97_17570 [Rhizomicrobium sp.]|nr:hypothetical protein [Rhizomicrobium sp.]